MPIAWLQPALGFFFVIVWLLAAVITVAEYRGTRDPAEPARDAGF